MGMRPGYRDERFLPHDERAMGGRSAQARRYPRLGARGTFDAAELPTNDIQQICDTRTVLEAFSY